MNHVTELLRAWSNGDEQAFNQLQPYVDPSLKKMAHSYLRDDRREDLLQTTALVNEALMKLIQENHVEWEDRNHFYAFVAKRMQEVLLNSARRRNAGKRNFGTRIPMSDADVEGLKVSEQLIILDEALKKLEQQFPDRFKITQLKFFVGLSFEDIGDSLGIASRTAQRKWEIARAWLIREMTGDPSSA